MKLLTEATWVTKLKPPFGFISEGALFGQLFSLVRFHYFKHSAETDYNTSRLHLSSIINIILRKRGRLAKDVKDYDNSFKISICKQDSHAGWFKSLSSILSGHCRQGSSLSPHH